MRLIALLALIITLFPSPSWGLDVDLILVKGGVTRQQAIQAFIYARGKISEVGVDIRLRSVKVVPNTGPTVNLSNWNKQFWYWARWAYSHGYKRKGLTYVMIPPFYDNGVPYIGGQAEGVCSPRGYAVGNAEMVNHLGLDRFYHSATIMAHEIGHLLGASHTSEQSIMNVGALSYIPVTSLSFSPSSGGKIRRCLGL